MNIIDNRFQKIYHLPTIHLAMTHYCNLDCPYCPIIDRLKFSHTTSKHLDLLFTIKDILPISHFYLTGGEPLYSEKLEIFFNSFYQAGHIFSFDTNCVININKLEQLLNIIPVNQIGFFNISFHLGNNYSYDYILERCKILKKYKVPHFVKFIGIPNNIEKIRKYKKIFTDNGIGTAVTMFETYPGRNYLNKSYPKDYTENELYNLLSLVTLLSHGIQFFGGIFSKNNQCSAGYKYITFNFNGNGEIGYCCHKDNGISFENFLAEFSKNNKINCKTSICHGDIMTIFNINNVINKKLSEEEKIRFQNICYGYDSDLNFEKLMDSLKIVAQENKFVFENKFNKFYEFINV